MRTALITGASAGVGRATAAAMAAAGDRVLLVARRAEALEAVARDCGAAAHALPCDASNPGAVTALMAEVTQRWGSPDVVVNSAGAGRWLRLEDTPLDEAEAMMGAPFRAAYLVSRAALPGMLARGSGVLIHVQSPAAFVPWPGSVMYAASRAALRGLHEALLTDLKRSGVTSCQAVFGEITSEYFAANDLSADQLPRLGKLLPKLTPEDCARVLVGLARRPRPMAVAPGLLAPMLWGARLAPGAMSALVRASMPRATRRN